MKSRLILLLMGIAALSAVSFTLHAQDQGKKGPTPIEKDDLVTDEQQLARQFADFQDKLLRLKQKLARGTPEEKKKADIIGSVLEECKNLAINQEFSKMLEILRTAKLSNTGNLSELKDQSDVLAQRLRKILDMLQNSDSDRLSQDRKNLEQLIKDLQKTIDQQKTVQAQTDNGKTDNKELGKNQDKVTQNTKKVETGIKKYLDKDKESKGGEAANPKGENKEGKGEGKKGESKDAGESKSAEAKQGETKDAGKNSQASKAEAKPGKEGDPKSASKSGDKGKEGGQQASAKENKGGDKGKEGSAKESKAGDKKSPEGTAKNDGQKPGDKTNPKEANPKEGSKQASAKAGDDKKPAGDPSGEAKPGGKPGESSPQAGAKPGAKGKLDAGDSKSGEAKSGQAKSAGGQQGEAKPGNEAKGLGQAKDGGNAAPNNPNDPAGAQASNKSDGQPSPPPQGSPPPGKQNDEVAQSHKQVKEAGYDQKIAEDNINKLQNQQASKNQADAIKKMEEAKKKLERLLNQMREDELERVLAALQARCEKMLIMQVQVLAGTEDVDKSIARTPDKKPTRDNKTAAIKLSDDEKLIVQEANKCIDILEAEGSAVAFPEVFQQVRQDMIHVQKRLELTDVQDVTQGIERDIIDTLKEMIEALKKARQEMQPPSPGQPGKAGAPGDQKLLELIQELKMVRSLQKRVNDRTEMYGKRYPGEQANEPQIIRELRGLGDRQLRIQDIVSRIAKGDNK